MPDAAFLIKTIGNHFKILAILMRIMAIKRIRHQIRQLNQA